MGAHGWGLRLSCVELVNEPSTSVKYPPARFNALTSTVCVRWREVAAASPPSARGGSAVPAVPSARLPRARRLVNVASVMCVAM